MKNRTKVLSFLLSLCILFSTLSVTVLAIGETQNITEEEKTDAMPIWMLTFRLLLKMQEKYWLQRNIRVWLFVQAADMV